MLVAIDAAAYATTSAGALIRWRLHLLSGRRMIIAFASVVSDLAAAAGGDALAALAVVGRPAQTGAPDTQHRPTKKKRAMLKACAATLGATIDLQTAEDGVVEVYQGTAHVANGPSIRPRELVDPLSYFTDDEEASLASSDHTFCTDDMDEEFARRPGMELLVEMAHEYLVETGRKAQQKQTDDDRFRAGVRLRTAGLSAVKAEGTSCRLPCRFYRSNCAVVSPPLPPPPLTPSPPPPPSKPPPASLKKVSTAS